MASQNSSTERQFIFEIVCSHGMIFKPTESNIPDTKDFFKNKAAWNVLWKHIKFFGVPTDKIIISVLVRFGAT